MSNQSTRSTNMVWMDLEMTGLNPEIDEILEIAVIVTDQNLNIIAKGPEFILQQPPERFQKMDQWNQEQHTKTGLWDSVLKSNTTCAEAEAEILAFLKQHTDERKSPLCGNSIWQDRRFLVRYMPKLEAFLHYRLVDVSTVKELAMRWYPDVPKKFTKKSNHRALEDVVDSINELQFYRTQIFIAQGT